MRYLKNHVSTLFMVPNAILYNDAMPSGMGVLEVADPNQAKKLFVPLQETKISGDIQGLFATCLYTQIFGFKDSTFNYPIEVVYRFPIPVGGIVTGISLKSADEEIESLLVERSRAQDDYYQTFKEGKLGSLLVQESPDIFTLFVTGINPDAEITVSVSLTFRAFSEGNDTIFRFPLTTVPRFIHEINNGKSLKKSLPFFSLMDPGYQASIFLSIYGYGSIKSTSHKIKIEKKGDTEVRVSFSEGTTVPNQDFVLTCTPRDQSNRTIISCLAYEEPKENVTYVMTTISPPEYQSTPKNGDFVILADGSYPENSQQREEINSAVRTFLHSLQEGDVFSLGLFNSDSIWLSRKSIPVTPDSIKLARNFLSRKISTGGPNLSDAVKKGYSVRKGLSSVPRHLVLITHGRMSDDGKIFRIIRDELKKKEPRSLSVLCIEACPNAALIEELARKGIGIARFVPSNTEKKDITNTIEGMVRELHDYSSHELFLHVNREYIETADGGIFSEKVPFSVFGRERFTQFIKVPNGYPLSIHLEGYGKQITIDIQYLDTIPVKKLFGAVRIQILEQITQGLHSLRDISDALHELGYSHSGERNVSPLTENVEYSDIYELIVQESLRYGVPSSQTALIAQGKKEGKQIKATIIIPSAHSLSDSPLLCNSIPIDNLEMCSMENLYSNKLFEEIGTEMPPKLSKERIKHLNIKCKSPDYLPIDNRKNILPLPILRSVSTPPDQGTGKIHDIRIDEIPESDGIIYNKIAESSFSIHAILRISIPSEGEIRIFIGEEKFPRTVVTTLELNKDGIYPVHIDVKKGERVKIFAQTIEMEKISIVLLLDN